mmetsp:Transcript_12506/g.15025  ORF Transcript_12506/g.15025 Transcript_12506/m.15025 type:complete len:525 (+) Transcript_12506:84-1658(+)|eukprot:CAMPEP_0197844688 /NCGR_PEP_ID=MMETSP1438-20131217/1672_1 /TAXON_ID=1461541 /ORGANISM="Pterosperma sp., Strain CCMP1384" /LENGTH=524 /DNA_ID=CAMNT_0043455625 /DNA_START=84 /DNA_END=1658 /DNA_ORIENTATION=-
MQKLLSLLVASAAVTGVVANDAVFLETFSGEDPLKGWVHSTADNYDGKFEVGLVEGREVEDPALVLPVKAKKYGISKLLETPIDISQGVVFQYEVTFTEGMTCGGAYVKLVSETGPAGAYQPAQLDGDTAYSIMFGPDKCGETQKVHMILRHKNPLSGRIEEKHLRTPPTPPQDELPHLYTLIIDADNTFQILIDNEVAEEGDLASHFQPSFTPPEEINDPEDFKPADWVDIQSIPDPTATKPEDWDEDAPEKIIDDEAEMPEGWLPNEEEYIDDPEAEMPEDWDEEEDGDWEAPKIENPACDDAPGCGEWKKPMIPNPAYKGKWTPPIIPNPEYKGAWAPRRIPNPEYFDEKAPLTNIAKIGAVAVEIWTMDQGVYFDSFVMAGSDEAAEVDELLNAWEEKHSAEKARIFKKESTAPPQFLQKVAAALDDPRVAPYKHLIMPAIDVFMDYPVLLYVILGVLPVLFIVIVFACCSGGSADDEPEEEDSKKTDETEDQSETKEGEVIPPAKDEDTPTKRRTRRDN